MSFYREISNTTPKAKKAHCCIWCGEDIDVGVQHYHIVSVYMGDFQDHRFHIECINPCHEVCDENEGEFEPHGNVRGSLEAKP